MRSLLAIFILGVCIVVPASSFCTALGSALNQQSQRERLTSRSSTAFVPFSSSRLPLRMSNEGASKPDTDTSMPEPSAIDERAYEEERLKLDSKAREEMQVKLSNLTQGGQLRSPWKWEIRQRIWDLMEEQDIACQPRPVHHRIPNFVGADEAAAKMCSLPEFQNGKVIKVNPDTPQKAVRLGVLSSGKVLMTPQPRLRTGFFSTLSKDTIPDGTLRECCTSVGVAKHGTPLTLDDDVKVDLVVVGSTAVCPKTGARVGKGEGFAELEYGMLRMMEAITENTLVVTSVNDVQVVDDIPSEELLKHDLSVDVICTPTRVIRVPDARPKPTGIYWDLLSPEKLSQVRVLQRLKASIEEKTGEKLPTGPSETLPPLAERNNRMRGRGGQRGRGRGRGRAGRGGQGGSSESAGGEGGTRAETESRRPRGASRGRGRGGRGGRGRGKGPKEEGHGASEPEK